MHMSRMLIFASFCLSSYAQGNWASASESYTPPRVLKLAPTSYADSSNVFFNSLQFGSIRRTVKHNKFAQSVRTFDLGLNKRRTSSGMVMLEYVINTDGKAEQILIVDSTHSNFESRAIRTIKGAEFLPARIDDKEVVGRDSAVLFFSVEEELAGVSKRFKKRYEELKKRLAKDSRKELKRVGRGIKRTLNEYSLNLYSLAWLYHLQWEYALKIKSISLQQQSLEKLVALESQFVDNDTFLNQYLRATIRKEQVLLDIRLGKIGLALERYENLKLFSKEAAQEIEPIMIKVIAAIEDKKPIVQEFEVGERGFWIDVLSRRQLNVTAESGDIEKLEFRCEAQFFEAVHSDGNEYQIPKSWGCCRIQIIGDPASRGKLFQFSSTIS